MSTSFELQVQEAVENPEGIRDAVKEGLNIGWFDRLAELFGVTASQFADVMGMEARTLSRRRKEGKLSTRESSSLYHLAVVYAHALDVLGSSETVKSWFHAPEPDFAGMKPFELLDTAPGIQEVDQLLGRIEHGVF
jgi:putative toxin-antitoxin system antitoxin component (TIGR02293 family)